MSKEKTVITLYSGFLPKDFPEELKKYQALNYDSIGSMKDLQKGISDTLGIKPKEVETTKLYKRNYKLTIMFSVILFFSIVLLVFTVIQSVNVSKSESVYETTVSSETPITTVKTTELKELSDEEKFAEAKKLASENKYADAIDMFESIHNYNHSVDELSLLFAKYAGYYFDETDNISFHINKTGSEAAIIEIRLKSDNVVVNVSESFVFAGTSNEIQYADSFNNVGTIEIKLGNDEIEFKINSTKTENDYYIGSVTYKFKLSERADSPKDDEITLDTISYWFNNDYFLADFNRDGYKLNKTYYWNSEQDYQFSGTFYNIENTSIVLMFYNFDYEFGRSRFNSEDFDDLKLYAVRVNTDFFSDKDIIEDKPFVVDGLYIMPGMNPNVFDRTRTGGYGYYLADDVFLIVDERTATDAFRDEAAIGYVDYSYIEDELAGWWTTAGNRGGPTSYYYQFRVEYGDMEIFIHDNTDGSNTHDSYKLARYEITSDGYVKVNSIESGNGTYYLLIDGVLECHWENNGYSGSSSLIRTDEDAISYYDSFDDGSVSDDNYDEEIEDYYNSDNAIPYVDNTPSTEDLIVRYEWYGSNNGKYINVERIVFKVVTSDINRIKDKKVFFTVYYNGQSINGDCTSSRYDEGDSLLCDFFSFPKEYYNEQGYLISGEYRCVVELYDKSSGKTITLAESTCTVVCE